MLFAGLDYRTVPDQWESIQKAISDQPVIYDKTLLNVEVSIGFALYQAKYVDIDDMLKVADEHMYIVKHNSELSSSSDG